MSMSKVQARMVAQLSRRTRGFAEVAGIFVSGDLSPSLSEYLCGPMSIGRFHLRWRVRSTARVGPLAGARASGRLLMECLPGDTSLAGTNASLYSKINRCFPSPTAASRKFG
jgi:hypothetical protein